MNEEIESLKIRVKLLEERLLKQSLTLCYVNKEGGVLIPQSTREELGLMNGGSVSFVRRIDGHVEMLNHEQMLALFTEDEVNQ